MKRKVSYRLADAIELTVDIGEKIRDEDVPRVLKRIFNKTIFDRLMKPKSCAPFCACQCLNDDPCTCQIVCTVNNWDPCPADCPTDCPQDCPADCPQDW